VAKKIDRKMSNFKFRLADEVSYLRLEQ